jgi:hypothetical protein
VQAELAKAQINQSLVEQYKASIEAALSAVEIYKARIAGIQVKAEIEKTKIEAYGEQVRAYVAKINAYTAGVEGYRASSKPRAPSRRSTRARSRHSARAWAPRPSRPISASQRTRAARRQPRTVGRLQGRDRRRSVEGAGGQLRTTRACRPSISRGRAVTSFNEVLTKQWQAAIDEAFRVSDIGVNAAKANAELYMTTRSLALDAAKVGAQVSAQLGAAALNAINWSTVDLPRPATARTSFLAGYSNQTVEISSSTSTNTNYNYSASV